jgi:hypothetical protein
VTIDSTPTHKRIARPWLTWLIIGIAVASFIAFFLWKNTVFFGMEVLSFDPEHPRLNPHATRVLTIYGTQPDTLPIQFVAFYSASRPWFAEPGYESCYKTSLGPIAHLHLSEPLKVEHDGSHYKTTVVVDKYEPGDCRWRLSFVSYKIVNSIDAEIYAADSTWVGTATLSLVKNDATWPDHGMPKYPRGRVDIWCAKQSWAKDSRYAEACGALAGLSRNDYSGLIPADQRGDEVLSGVFPDDQSAEINFHDLDAWKSQQGLSEPKSNK